MNLVLLLYSIYKKLCLRLPAFSSGNSPFTNSALPSAYQLACLPSADTVCSFHLAFWPQTVASFLISSKTDPLLSINSVASFFQKLSAFCRQPPGFPRTRLVLHFCHFFLLLAYRRRPLAKHSALKRWLRSSLFHSPVLCFLANRWLRFQKTLSFQPSAVRFRSPDAGLLLHFCHLPFAILSLC